MRGEIPAEEDLRRRRRARLPRHPAAGAGALPDHPEGARRHRSTTRRPAHQPALGKMLAMAGALAREAGRRRRLPHHHQQRAGRTSGGVSCAHARPRRARASRPACSRGASKARAPHRRNMGSFSIWHWLIVLVIVMLIFGTKKLRNIGTDLGGAVQRLQGRHARGRANDRRSRQPVGADHRQDDRRRSQGKTSRRPERPPGRVAGARRGAFLVSSDVRHRILGAAGDRRGGADRHRPASSCRASRAPSATWPAGCSATSRT